jgi:hypothetical protein
MIIYPAKNLFQAKFPTIEDHEEEIFFQHPKEDIKCNQLGVLYYDEDRYSTYPTASGATVREHQKFNKVAARSVGSKTKIVWECYHQEILEIGAHCLFLNANPLDMTKENIIMLSKTDPATKKEASKAKAKFISNSIDHLIGLERKFEKEGISNQQLHKLLQIPNWLACARKKHKGPEIKARIKNNLKKDASR